MSVDLATQDLEIAPVELRALTSHEWSEVEEEPDLDIILRSRRGFRDGMPGSQWLYGYVVEGVTKGALSQPQRDYAAALLRHVADLIQDERGSMETSLARRAAMLANRYRQEMAANMAAFINLAAYVVNREGLGVAAGWLGLKEKRLSHLLKSRQNPTLRERG